MFKLGKTCANLPKIEAMRKVLRCEKRNSASAERSIERKIAATHLEAVTRIERLDVKNIATCKAQNALDRRRDVLVHAVGKFDHDDRSFARCTYQLANDGAGATAKLSEHDLHDRHRSTVARNERKLHKVQSTFRV